MIAFDQNQTEWGSRLIYPDGHMTPWNPERWVIHYGGGENEAGDKTDIAAEQQVLRSWQSWHIDGRGWQDIAYNYAIGQTGTIYRLRGENRAAATRGDFEPDGIPENHEARAVVFILGGAQEPTPHALQAFQGMWATDPLPVIGHKDVAIQGEGGTPTACPGSYLYTWIHEHGYMGEQMHQHQVPPDALPRQWADATWNEWVQRSGTDPDSRTHEFYREDLGWVYSRVIEPLEVRVRELAAEVEALKDGSNALTLPATVTLSQPE